MSFLKFLDTLIDFFLKLCGLPSDDPDPAPGEPTDCHPETELIPTSETPRIVNVALIFFLPKIGVQFLWEYLWWTNPQTRAALKQCELSENDGCRYKVLVVRTVYDFPPLADGDRYDLKTYLAALRDPSLIKREPASSIMKIDHEKAISEAAIPALAQAVDQFWFFAPCAGFTSYRFDTRRITYRVFNYEQKELVGELA